MTNEDRIAYDKMRAKQRAEKRAIQLMNELIELTNDSELGDAVAEAISEAIKYEHPTKMQIFMRRWFQVNTHLAKSPTFGNDLRGAASKQFVQHVQSFEGGFPYV